MKYKQLGLHEEVRSGDLWLSDVVDGYEILLKNGTLAIYEDELRKIRFQISRPHFPILNSNVLRKHEG